MWQFYSDCISKVLGSTPQVKVDAVSYTHLDVYKRQIISSLSHSWLTKTTATSLVVGAL